MRTFAPASRRVHASLEAVKVWAFYWLASYNACL